MKAISLPYAATLKPLQGCLNWKIMYHAYAIQKHLGNLKGKKIQGLKYQDTF